MMPVSQKTLFSDKNIYYGSVVAALFGLAAAGWYGYTWYKRGQERAAYKSLAETVEGYTKFVGGYNPEKLADSERAFRAGAQAHSSSGLYPFFLFFQADTLIEQDKLKEAVGLLDTALSKMSAKQPLYYEYALKRALVKIDVDDASLQKQGRDELETLMRDGANPSQDMALYYGALDAQARGDKITAAKRFEEIVAHGKTKSYWHQLAETQLKSGV
jgi:hypothetical protein